MEEGERQMGEVRRAASRGARSVSKSKQLIYDAAEYAVAQWSKAVMSGSMPQHLEQWAFRVGANAAKAGGRRAMAASSEVLDPGFDLAWIFGEATAEESTCLDLPAARRVLRAQLQRHEKNLVGRQFEVVSKLCEHGMTLHQAAKELGMDRKSLRRSFRTALARLRRQ